MVYLLKMVIFHGYVSYDQMANINLCSLVVRVESSRLYVQGPATRYVTLPLKPAEPAGQGRPRVIFRCTPNNQRHQRWNQHENSKWKCFVDNPFQICQICLLIIVDPPAMARDRNRQQTSQCMSGKNYVWWAKNGHGVLFREGFWQNRFLQE